MMPEITATYYDCNGVRLHVLEAGAPGGPVLLLLHGFPEAGFAWQWHLRFFARQGYRVLAPDQRGYNRSSRPHAVAAYRMAHLVQDMVSLIQSVTSEKVFVAGHDWGGGVAWQLALRHPELVHRLVVLNMPHPKAMYRVLRTNRHQQVRSSYAFFFQLPFLPERVCRAFNCRLLQRTLRRTSLPGTFGASQMAQYKEAWKTPGALRGMINWYRAYRRHDAAAAGRVTVPVLLVWGKKDHFLLPELATRSALFADDIRLEMLDDATHWLHHEQAEKVSALMFHFLSANGGAAAGKADG